MKRFAAVVTTLVFLGGGTGCAVYGGVESATVKVENGTAEVTSRSIGGGVRCEPGRDGSPPCRVEAP